MPLSHYLPILSGDMSDSSVVFGNLLTTLSANTGISSLFLPKHASLLQTLHLAGSIQTAIEIVKNHIAIGAIQQHDPLFDMLIIYFSLFPEELFESEPLAKADTILFSRLQYGLPEFKMTLQNALQNALQQVAHTDTHSRINFCRQIVNYYPLMPSTLFPALADSLLDTLSHISNTQYLLAPDVITALQKANPYHTPANRHRILTALCNELHTQLDDFSRLPLESPNMQHQLVIHLTALLSLAQQVPKTHLELIQTLLARLFVTTTPTDLTAHEQASLFLPVKQVVFEFADEVSKLVGETTFGRYFDHFLSDILALQHEEKLVLIVKKKYRLMAVKTTNNEIDACFTYAVSQFNKRIMTLELAVSTQLLDTHRAKLIIDSLLTMTCDIYNLPNVASSGQSVFDEFIQALTLYTNEFVVKLLHDHETFSLCLSLKFLYLQEHLPFLTTTQCLQLIDILLPLFRSHDLQINYTMWKMANPDAALDLYTFFTQLLRFIEPPFRERISNKIINALPHLSLLHAKSFCRSLADASDLLTLPLRRKLCHRFEGKEGAVACELTTVAKIAPHLPIDDQNQLAERLFKRFTKSQSDVNDTSSIWSPEVTSLFASIPHSAITQLIQSTLPNLAAKEPSQQWNSYRVIMNFQSLVHGTDRFLLLQKLTTINSNAALQTFLDVFHFHQGLISQAVEFYQQQPAGISAKTFAEAKKSP